MSSADLSGYSTAQLQAMLAAGDAGPAPAATPAPADAQPSAAPAPAAPPAYPGLPAGTYKHAKYSNVVMNPDGKSIYGLGDFTPDDGSGDIQIGSTTDPAAIAAFVQQHPDVLPQPTGGGDTGAGPPSGAPPAAPSGYAPSAPDQGSADLSRYSTAELQAMLGPEGANEPDPSSPQGKALAEDRAHIASMSPLLSTPESRAMLSGLTFGFDDELDGAGAAARTWLGNLVHGGGDLSPADAFHAAATARREAKGDFAQAHPLENFGLNLAGGLANPVSALGGEFIGAAPSFAGALGRGALLGAGEGATYGVGDGDTLQSRLTGGATGAVTGMAAGMAAPIAGEVVPMVRRMFGGRAAAPVADAGPMLSSAAQIADAGPKATLPDYDVTGVDPMLAVNGSRAAQQVGQTLMGVPFAGAPLAKAAGRTQAQAKSFLASTAARFGDAGDAAAAGAPIMQANADAEAALAARRQGATDSILDIARGYGGGASPQLTGADVQTAVKRFAGVDHHAPILDVGAFPVRASSFGAKAGALYDKAFNRLEEEIPGGVRQTGDAPIGGPQPRDEMDDVLDAARKGLLPKMKGRGPSLTEFVAKNGGVRDDGGDLAAMDAGKFHLGKPFMRKVINPQGVSLGDMAQTAYDAGYFPDAKVPSWESSDQMQAISGQDLAEAIRDELAGKRRYAGEAPSASYRDEGVRSTMDFLERHAIDPKDMTNDQIRVAQDNVGRGLSAGAQHINPSATRAVLKDINGRAQSEHVRGLLDAPQLRKVAAAVHNSETLSFQDLRSLRTWVRQEQADPSLSNRISAADLQRMEGALTDDMQTNATRLASPGAARMLRRADQFYAAGQQRISRALAAFDDSRSRSGESVFDKIVTSAGSGSSADLVRLRALKRSLQPEDWREVASTAIMRMGRGQDGEFDLGRFLHGYGKLSAEGAGELFGGRNPKLGASLREAVGEGREAVAATAATHFAATGPEKAFQDVLNASRAKGGSADLAAVHALKGVLEPEQWGQVAAGALNTMGRDGAGGFSMPRFVTEWDKLSPAAKDALFNGEGRAGEAAGLDSLVRVMRTQVGAEKFYNHSNSAHAGGTMVALMEGFSAMAEGNLHHIGGMAAGAAGGRVIAHVLAAPGFARLAMRAAKASTPAASAAADRGLARVGMANPAVSGAINAYRAAMRTSSGLAAGRAGAAMGAGLGTPASTR